MLILRIHNFLLQSWNLFSKLQNRFARIQFNTTMESDSVPNALPHQHLDGVFDSKKMDESDVENQGTTLNDGSETKEDEEPSPRQIHGIKVSTSKVNVFRILTAS